MQHEFRPANAASISACRWHGCRARASLLALGLVSVGFLANVARAEEPSVPRPPAAAKPALDDDDPEFLPLGISTVVDGNAARRRAIQVNNPQARQLALQMRPVLIAELALARQICGDLTIAERQRIKAAGEVALQSLAPLTAKHRKLLGRMRADEKPDSSHPVDQLRARLASAIKEHAPPETSQRYAVEAARRIENRRRAAINLTVARLDALLYLTAEQRQEIAASLADFWQTDWEKWAQFNLPLPYLPAIPEGHVRCLNADQNRVWHSLQKIDLASRPVIQLGDDPWWDEPKSIDDRVFEIMGERLE